LPSGAAQAPLPEVPLQRSLALVIATFFGSGYAPVAPGTVGTAAALPLAWLASLLPLGGQLALLVAVTATGIWAAGIAGRTLGVVDARPIVIDEVAGTLVTLIGLPFTLPNAIAAFLLFRLFDILKPWPASYFDRKVKTGAGVVLDDVMAGLYARACMFVLTTYAGQWFASS
jgi:phosphatidylglycerophosphatase A